MKKSVIGSAVAATLLLALVRQVLPDIRRYLHIRKM
ncbi:DUF6893 family small protein [Streptomyces lateritius]|uniref:DUF6893 family small protein n=1 Tax=Streptomyces lateritius TaxID=67313 RepID=A0ABW6YC78_9ACTN